jgi:hypothetical protein
MLRPGFLRGLIGMVLFGIIIGVLYLIVRVVLFGLAPDQGGGAALMFGGFGAAFGWLWGVGSFNPGAQAHEGPAVYAATHASDKPGFATVARDRTLKLLPHLISGIRPMLQPLLIALGICVAVVIISLLVGTVLPTRIQTYNPDASVAELTQNKAVIFIIISVVILGALATMAVVLGLVMSWLTREVEVAKKSPDNPPPQNPTLFRLIDFVLSWINDIIEGTRRSLTR